MKRLLLSMIYLCIGIVCANAEATDINDYDDVIYVSNVETTSDNQVTLSVKMKNSFDAPGFQFDLVLPEGFSVAKDADNMYLIALSTERTTSKKTNYFDGALQADGSFRVLCNTSAKDTSTGKLYVFSGNDGEVCTITLDVASTVANGTYEIGLKNIEISDLNSVGHPITDEIVSTITVKDDTPSYDDGYALSVIPTSIASATSAAKSTTVSLAMKTAAKMHSVSFDMYWNTEAALYKKSGSYQAFYDTDSYDPADEDENYVNVNDEGYTNGANISFTDDTGNDFETSYESIVNLTFRAPKGTANGVYTVDIKNIVFTDADGKTYKATPYSFDIYVGSTTATVTDGTVAFHGDYSDEDVAALMTDAMPIDDATVTTVDLTGVTALPESTEITTANPNALILTSTDLGLANENNVVVNKTCANLVLTDGNNYACSKKFTATNASYSRTMSNTWGTICLPYDVKSDVSAAYYKITDISNDVITLEQYQTLPAGTPALVKKLSESTISAQANDVAVNGTINDVEGSVDMIGSYTSDVQVADANAYYIRNDQFHQCSDYFYIDAFRAYFTYSAGGSKSSILTIGDDSSTAINALTGNSDVTIESVYDVSGTRQKDLKKGLNVIKLSNGKTQKVMIK